MRKVIIFALSLLGIFDSSYLLWAYTSPSHRMVCGLGDGCDAVRASPFAHPWGVPLPVFGLAMYGALASLVFIESWRGKFSRLVVLISGAGFLASLYLTGLEAFVIHAWCAWCVVSALTVTAIFALALWDSLSWTRRPSGVEPLPTAYAGHARPLNRPMLLVLISALLVGVPGFRYLSLHGQTPARPEILKVTPTGELVPPDSHTTGNPQASLTVVEFADFQCPACKGNRAAVEAIRHTYGDRVRFVFRQLPLSNMHPFAEKAAEASECAAEQAKFWEMQDKLFRENDLSEPALVNYAAQLGLDRDRFSHCLRTGLTAPRVQRDVADAHALGFRGTPTLVIGQEVHVGPMTESELARAIDQELAARRTANATGSSSSSASSSSKGASSSSGGTLGGDAAEALSQLGGTPACSEDEARKRQPALIRTDGASRLFRGPVKALFVDVRPPAEFAPSHVPGSINIPYEQVAGRWSELPKDRVIILYESGRGAGDNICAASRAAGRILIEHGFDYEHVKVYQDGLAGWQNAGLPVQRR